jgi:uncharacterized protein (DUF433 family)/DNA-binding transcriptional MerR regulator
VTAAQVDSLAIERPPSRRGGKAVLKVEVERFEEARIEPTRGAYDAPRAAALAGIPLSTLHRWARKQIYTPSIDEGPRLRLWSWGDLLALRAIDWFRRTKGPDEPPAVSMRKIRAALDELDREGISRDRLYGAVAVSDGGKLFLRIDDGHAIAANRSRQGAMAEVLHLVGPYRDGPDLLEPRPLLRIIPGKLHGEPHIVNTRIPSALVFNLAQEGYSLHAIREMYPEADHGALDQAIEFERSLRPAA